ncbi:MAG: rhodanese-like domain-containing protein [Blastochloris sp.]|jgi:adenylyltransferase/sulfurtransferase|nr:rhodanese-like domain-containing protein [Blastochloris sp.]
MESLSAAQVVARLKDNLPFRLVDVREQDEWDMCRLPQAELVPLSTFTESALAKLLPSDEIILYCHHGVRSERAGLYLLSKNFINVKHLAGGIDSWSLEVDSSVKRY